MLLEETSPEAIASGGATSTEEVQTSPDVIADSSTVGAASESGGDGGGAAARPAGGQGSRTVPIDRLNEVIHQREEYRRKYQEALRNGAPAVDQRPVQKFFDDETDRAVRALAQEVLQPQMAVLQREQHQLKLERLHESLRKLDGWDEHAEDVIRRSAEIVDPHTGEINFERLGEVILKATQVDKGVYAKRAKERADQLNEQKARGSVTTGQSAGGEPAKPKPRSQWTSEERAAERRRNLSKMRG